MNQWFQASIESELMLVFISITLWFQTTSDKRDLNNVWKLSSHEYWSRVNSQDYRTDNLSLSNRIRSLWITALSSDLVLIVILTSCCWMLSLCNQSLHYSAVRKCSLLELGPLVLILSKGGKKIPSHGLWLVSLVWMQPSHWLGIMKLS